MCVGFLIKKELKTSTKALPGLCGLRGCILNEGGHYCKIDFFPHFIAVIKRGRLIEKVQLILACVR